MTQLTELLEFFDCLYFSLKLVNKIIKKQQKKNGFAFYRFVIFETIDTWWCQQKIGLP